MWRGQEKKKKILEGREKRKKGGDKEGNEKSRCDRGEEKEGERGKGAKRREGRPKGKRASHHINHRFSSPHPLLCLFSPLQPAGIVATPVLYYATREGAGGGECMFCMGYDDDL